MVKIEAETLESAYSQAAEQLSCSITQLNIEVIQAPKSGLFGLFKKQAIIVATSKVIPEAPQQTKQEKSSERADEVSEKSTKQNKRQKTLRSKPARQEVSSHNDIILPESFVTDQEDDYDGSDIYADEEEESVYVGEETETCDKSHDEIHEQLAKTAHPSSHSQAIDNFF